MKTSKSYVIQLKAGLLAVCLSLISILWWEFHLRSEGITISYDDNNALWANNRSMVYEPRDQATVFIGSSRIKFDLDIPTWQAITGDHAIQLANVGNSPRPALEDLANDKNFKGKLVVDVTEEIFFSEMIFNEDEIRSKISYYHQITPTQRASFQINRFLESNFVFLDQFSFSLNAMLAELKIPKRPGVFPDPLFPFDFDMNSFPRQSYMSPRFLADTSLQNRVKAIWDFFISMNPEKPITGHNLDSILNWVKTNTDKIRTRGGEVIFVRTPASGKILPFELKEYPRNAYWDRLLAVTGCKGIYFEDYPAIAHFECPESSHLSPDQAVIFTNN